MSEWVVKKLGEIISLQRGHDLPIQVRFNGSIPVLGSSGLTGWHNEVKKEGPGVVVGRSGNSMGAISFTADDFWPLNTCLYVTDFKGNHERFIYYLLQTVNFDQFNSGSAQKSLNRNAVYPYKVSLPKERQEQEKIARILESLENKIELNRQSNQTLEQIAQAIFKSWFVDFEPTRAKQHMLTLQQRSNPTGNADASISEEEAAKTAELAAQAVISGSLNLADIQAVANLDTLRQQLENSLAAKLINQTDAERQQLTETASQFPNKLVESELGETPIDWDIGTIRDLFELHRGFDLPKSKRKDGDHLVYAAGGPHGSHNEYKMLPPGVITGRSGVIGNVYLALEKYWPLNTTLYVREFKSCGPYYAYHFLNHSDLEVLNSGSAVPSLNRNFVHSLTCCIPSADILRAFEQTIAIFFEMIKKNNDTSDQLREIRNTLLPKLLSGELAVNPPN